MTKKPEIKEKNPNLIENGKRRAEVMWGRRVLVSIFPLNRGKYRLTYLVKGQKTTLAGTDRLKLIDQAFDQMRELLK